MRSLIARGLRTALWSAAPAIVAVTHARAQSPRACVATDAARVAEQWNRIRPILESTQRVFADKLETLAIGRFERLLDREGNERFEGPIEARRFGVAPFRTASPAELATQGYMVTDSTGVALFRGPDASLFLSPEFLRDYCFRLVQGRDVHAGMTGLAFRPTTVKRVVDIDGTFWGDDSAAVRVVEFAFRGGLPEGTRDAGGRLIVERLASGNWIVRDWVMRAPVIAGRTQLLGYREEGGQTMLVSASAFAIADSVANSRRPPGRISGVVVNRLDNQAFIGARVWIDSGGRETRSDTVGAFMLRAPPGVHTLRFAHPLLDSLGIHFMQKTVSVVSDSTTNVVMNGPSIAQLRAQSCPDSTWLMTGTVRDVSSHGPIDSAAVVLSWIEIGIKDGKLLGIVPREVAVPNDSSGRYAACVAPHVEVTAHVRAGTARTGRVDLRQEDRGVTIFNFSIDPTTTDTVNGSAVLRGVAKYYDGTPMTKVELTLTDPDRVVQSDDSGRFVIAGIPGGTRVVDARAPGHAPGRAVVDARPGDTTDVAVYLRKVQTLEGIVVRAAASDRSTRLLAELEERRRLGIGYRLSLLELMSFRHSQLDAVIRSIPFTRVRYTPRGAQVRMTGTGGRECEPDIWVDGRKVPADYLNMFGAGDAVAVEFFTRESQVPLRFKNFSGCGAIVITTRDATEGRSQNVRR